MGLALSILASLVPVATCYALRWWLRRERLQPFWIFPVLVLLGGLGGVLFSVGVGPVFEPLFEGWDLSRPLLVDGVVGPLTEEIGKGLILLVFLATPWFRSPVDGLLYGLAAGSGFAVVENLYYFLVAYSSGGDGAWVASVAIRLPSSILIHGGATAIVGLTLGAARWERRALVVFAALPAALFLATALHGGWNALVYLAKAQGSAAWGGAALALLPVTGAALAGLLYAGLRSEAAHVREELAAAPGYFDPAEVEQALVLWRRRRRSPRDSARTRAVIALAFALRRRRLEGRGSRDVERLRAEVEGALRAEST